jgi:CPA2 family monovalent cation:H+ antiporter-2
MGVRLGVRTGLALAQTGEFSFVLAGVAATAGLLDRELHQVFIAGSIATLVTTPMLVSAAPAIALRLTRSDETEDESATDGESGRAGHVVLVGFGLAGQNVARVLRSREIEYVAVDTNAAAVREAVDRGEPVVYGDASRRAILYKMGVREARLVVVAVNDPVATREVVALARRLAPDVPVLARTHFVLDVDKLTEAGATKVVVEELESTLELVSEMLRHFGVPEDSIVRFTAELRDEGYVFLRTPEMILDPWLSDLLEGVASEWIEVPEHFPGEASFTELAVRERTGASVVAVERQGATEVSPPASYSVRAGDRLLAVGAPNVIEALRDLLVERSG